MEDTATSNTSAVVKKTSKLQLGMSAFGARERQAFGQRMRLAMACIERRIDNKTAPSNTDSLPEDAEAIRKRLYGLTQAISSQHADLLELLVRFDEMKGWECSGQRHCAAWMNFEIGISLTLSWEYLRVGRKLRELPFTTALFRAGAISWSKVRLIASVATADNEETLCHAALDASVSDIARLCAEYRWDENKDSAKNENERALQQWQSRTLFWKPASNGNTCIQLILPPETAQAFLNSVEHSLNLLNDNPDPDNPDPENPGTSTPDTNISARRADAAVLMAETSLQADSRDIAAADRYQVIVSVDNNTLAAQEQPTASTSEEKPVRQAGKNPSLIKAKIKTPTKRPTIQHAGPIAQETARRIACDCSITTNTSKNGEPVSVGRKSRLWPAAMARAIKDRDQHCQFYGCTQTRNLQIHHIIHWADGGTTDMENGVCLCQSCHTRVHEGGYRIQRVDNNEQRLDEQFVRQRQPNDKNSDKDGIEQQLRNNADSFNQVRTLLPTTHRFRLVNTKSQDIRDNYQYASELETDYANPPAKMVEYDESGAQSPGLDAANHQNSGPTHSTRVEFASCGKGLTSRKERPSFANNDSTRVKSEDVFEKHPWFVAESAARYSVRC